MKNASPPAARATLPDALARGQAVWLVLVLGVWSLWLLRFPLDPDYTSGELLDHVLRWRETGVLYPPLGAAPPMRVLNYPPLVLAMVRGLMAFGMPALVAGRAVNAVAIVGIVGAVAWWSRARGASGTSLLGSVGLLAASFPVVYGAGQFHVEMWAVFGTVAGFALADRARSLGGLALAGAVLALACFAKQTQVVPAAAALVWIAAVRPAGVGGALAAFASFAAVGLGGGVVTWLAFGPEMWRHVVVYTVGTFSPANLAWQMMSHAAPWLGLLAVAAWRGVVGGRAGRREAAWWYWCAAAVWSFAALRQGSAYAYYLDLHVATAVWVGPVLFRGGAVWPAGWVRRAAPWAIAVQVVGADVGVAAATGLNLDRLRSTERRLPALCAQFDATGPVLTEEAGLARACGRVPVLHPFIAASLAAQGLWDPTELEGLVASGSLGPALIPFDPTRPARGAHADRWTPGMLEAFANAPSVRLHSSGWWVVRFSEDGASREVP